MKLKQMLSFWLKRKGFFLFSSLRVASMVLGLVSNIIIVRKLTVGDFGIFSVALLVVNLITTFGFSWSSSSILYFGSREKEKHGGINKTFWARNIIIIVSLIVVTIGIILFREQINAYIGLNVWYLLLAWLYVTVLEDYLNQYFLAVKKQITTSMLSITAKIIYILLIIIVPFDVTTLIIIYIISHASVIFYILGINRKDIGNFEYDKQWFKEILNFSLWQLFGFSGIYLINFADIAVVKHFMTNEDVGIYNAAYQLFNAVASFAFVVSSYYASSVASYFAGKKQEKVQYFYYKERIFIVGLSIVGHLLLIFFSKPIITVLYGEAYLNTVPIFNILMLGSMIRYITVFYMLYYNTNGKHRIQQVINISIAIVNVVLSIWFVNWFGLNGPAYATVIVFFLSFLISLYYCEKRIIRFVKEGEQGI